MNVSEKIAGLLKSLNAGLYERERELKLALLSSIAGESIFLLGPPGVAKSLLARKMKHAYASANVFEYLMSRFSTPDEIFGPVAISKLKNDEYVRITDKYLPSSEIVFLDEIWKAGPSIQNALLTVVNEKVFRNGNTEIKVPMKALIAASNELPAKGQGLEALWDRFLVRVVVSGIEGAGAFNKMISEESDAYVDNVSEEYKITAKEYEAWGKRISDIAVPNSVFDVIRDIRAFADAHNAQVADAQNAIYVSDRRWRKIVRLLRTSAFINGRGAVDLCDCFLISHCIWNDVEQIPVILQFVQSAISAQKSGGGKAAIKNIAKNVAANEIVAPKKDVDLNSDWMKFLRKAG